MFFSDLRVGFFLAFRQIRRSNPWTTILIICVMILTFLNLVVISGLLVGLIENAIRASRERYISDIYIVTPQERQYLEQTPYILDIVSGFPEVRAVTPRYNVSGVIEAGYETRTKESEEPQDVTTVFAGIDPAQEEATTGLSDLLIEGEYLDDDAFDEVLLGALLLTRYIDFQSELFNTLDDTYPGDKIRIRIGDAVREVTVKGILKSKVDEIDRRVYIHADQLRKIAGRDDYSVDEISVSLYDPADAEQVKAGLIASGLVDFARVQTFFDAQPKFIRDIQDTFRTLGNIASSIGLVVASIAMFIVVFINAVTRRKFIGILKGLGISGRAIEISYMFQSLFFAIIGSIVGTAITYIALVPYFQANPIDFPFSDGILVAPPSQIFLSSMILIIVTIVAGYIPSRMIIRQNTLDSILGR